MTQVIGPEYRRLMDLIQSRIAAGEYPMGSKIPSTNEWEREGWSRDTVRTAITRLQQSGILEGHGGKGVFVKATPEQATREQADLKNLSAEVAALREQVEGRDDLAERVGRLEAILIDLFARLGFEYPHDGAKAARRGSAAG